MSVNDLRELSVQELQNKIVDLKKELMESRFALATSQIEDTSIFKKIKKEINGSNSYMKVLADNAKIRNVTNKDFTISTWFFAKDIPPYGESVDKNRCEYSIFSRPGFHTGLSYTHGGF